MCRFYWLCCFFVLMGFSTPFTQCPIHFLPTLPNSTFLSIPSTFFFIPTSFFVFLCRFYGWFGFLVLWFFSLFLLFLYSFYPIHPVSFTLIFTPLLNFLIKPNLSGRGLVKAMRNSTYKIGWKKCGTNCHICCHNCF